MPRIGGKNKKTEQRAAALTLKRANGKPATGSGKVGENELSAKCHERKRWTSSEKRLHGAISRSHKKKKEKEGKEMRKKERPRKRK